MAYNVFTLTDMQERLALMVESVPFWTADEATDAINEALMMMNLLTGYWRDTITVTTTPNDDYALGSHLTFQSRVLYDGKVMEPTSLFSMNNGRPNWRNEIAGDTGVPSRPYLWIPLDLDMILIWPRDTGGHTLTVEGVAETPVLVNPTDTIDLSEDAFHAILSFALVILSFKEGSERFTSSQPLFKTFINHCAEVNGQLKASGLFRRLLGYDAGAKATRGVPVSYPGQSSR